jgi:hypothetical protein
MSTVKQLIREVSAARREFLNEISNVTELQAQWKPVPEVWNITEITEHLFWAEHGAIAGMWKTIHAIRDGKTERTYDFVHKDLPVEEIIRLTWQEKEIVPAMAAPRLGGPLSFWKASLDSLQPVLEAFGSDLQEMELRLQAHPHPISGPMDFHQRLELLRFHINRHRNQVLWLLNEMR